ncbi:hypothetical protein [Prevotella pallens]|jgi:hypothetical protein|uniref:Uncharacterized protein n=2 Tax=Prevotella pallens TaxID=60133 RepID=A0A379GA46_9BACT|nr:hypothetical protein [Prevotella pallens]MBF1451240.1 hypothetical protein [Prevotella pallens]MBF1473222.1 hypothetical protein [Prevotella pallens]MBF1510117.1 hypothetical protein [Prevotella pallens]MBF1517317.1 hypothetical protein [Prevotella pallens]SUC37772.1 Uncharacterised protein [Prevotella pallens]
MLKPLTLVVLYIQINGNNLKKNFKTTFMVTKKLYVKPLFEVLSLYTDELLEGGFHARSPIHGHLDPGNDEPDPEDNTGGIDDQDP